MKKKLKADQTLKTIKDQTYRVLVSGKQKIYKINITYFGYKVT